MTDEPRDPSRLRAEAMVPPPENAIRIAIDARNVLVEAVAEDLRAGLVRTDEARLIKLEAQARVLAEAVIAIALAQDAIAPAVQAVKDEM
jgi:hypothetical protein